MADNENEFSKALQETENIYNKTVAQSLDILPDGAYQFVVDSAELIAITKDGAKIPTVKMLFLCVTPGFEKKSVTVWDRLNREESIKFFKEKLRRMGLDHNAPLSQLELILKDMINKLVTANVRTTKGTKEGQMFTNLYVQSCDGMMENRPF